MTQSVGSSGGKGAMLSIVLEKRFRFRTSISEKEINKDIEKNFEAMKIKFCPSSLFTLDINIGKRLNLGKEIILF